MYKNLYSQKDQIRSVSSPYFTQTLKNMLAHVENTWAPKVIIYSAHDTTIGMILVAMGFTSADCIAEHYMKILEN